MSAEDGPTKRCKGPSAMRIATLKDAEFASFFSQKLEHYQRGWFGNKSQVDYETRDPFADLQAYLSVSFVHEAGHYRMDIKPSPLALWTGAASRRCEGNINCLHSVCREASNARTKDGWRVAKSCHLVCMEPLNGSLWSSIHGDVGDDGTTWVRCMAV